MSFQSSDLFSIITIISVITLILGIAMPFFIVIYFRKTRLHREEKIKMNQEFESEVLKTHIKVQEQTMQIIAADLHDNIGQLLSLTTLTLNSIDIAHPQKSEEKIEASLSLVAKSIREVRDLAKLLQGEQMVEMGLGRAIEQELDWLKRTGRYKLIINNQIIGIRVLSPKKDLIILRLLQEIINNIIKHAKATCIEINVAIANDFLNLKIKENGVGFNFDEVNEQKRGMGLHSIQKRVEMITGDIKINSKPAIGTTITLQIPYP